MSKNSTINDQKDLRNKPLDCNDETLLDESVALLLNNRPALHKAVSTLLQKGSLVQLADLLKLSVLSHLQV
ncbi:hypothetical protein [Candidatus Tisiphia endosymbiont of Beris chalybata]|uniref:hypothetical protein n=1 Tax=Candidatus Tisiphia endosymbiont of Beris chalybata TaxID=3066262 RepID=UPI00312C7E84